MSKAEYYMNLPYRIEIASIPEELGGGYVTSIPQLGRKAFQSFGETADEALENLEKVKRHTFSKYLKNGIPIPEPEEEDEKEYSGRFVIRMPVELHRSLTQLAKANHSTLNQYITFLLTRRSVVAGVEQEIRSIVGSVRKIEYNVESLGIDNTKFERQFHGKALEYKQAS